MSSFFNLQRIHKINSRTNLLEIHKGTVEIRMRETGKMDDLNCKIQAHVRVSEESKLEEKMNAYLQNSIERLTVRYYPRNSEEIDFTVFTCDDTSQHKGTTTVLYLYNNVCNKQVLASVS